MTKIIDEVTKEANEAIRKAAKGSKMTYKVGNVDMPKIKADKYGVEMPKLTGKVGGKGGEMPSIGKLVDSDMKFPKIKGGDMPTINMKGVKYAEMPSLKGIGKGNDIPTLSESMKKFEKKRGKVLAENPIPAAAELPSVNEEVTL